MVTSNIVKAVVDSLLRGLRWALAYKGPLLCTPLATIRFVYLRRALIGFEKARRFEAGVAVGRKAADLGERIFRGPSLPLAECLNVAGRCYYHQFDSIAAEYFCAALEARRGAAGDTHDAFQAALTSLVSYLQELNVSPEKHKRYANELVQTTLACGGLNATAAWAYKALAQAQDRLGESEEAVNTYLKAAEAYRDCLGPHAPETLWSYHSAANALLTLGHLQRARELYTAVLTIFETLTRGTTISEELARLAVSCHSDLSTLHTTLGELTEAIEHSSNAMQIASSKLGWSTTPFLERLGELYQTRGDWASAEECYTNALQESSLSASTPSSKTITWPSAKALFSLATVQSALGKAGGLLTTADALLTVTSSSADRARAFHLRGQGLLDLGRVSEAEDSLVNELALLDNYDDCFDPIARRACLRTLAEVYALRGDVHSAELFIREAGRGSARHAEEWAHHLRALGVLRAATHNYPEAARLLAHATTQLSAALGPCVPEVLKCKLSLACAYRDGSALTNAHALFAEVLNDLLATTGRHTARYAEASFQFAVLSIKVGNGRAARHALVQAIQAFRHSNTTERFSYPTCLVQYATELSKAENNRLARALVEEAFSDPDRPFDADALAQAGFVFWAAGRTEDAMEAWSCSLSAHRAAAISTFSTQSHRERVKFVGSYPLAFRGVLSVALSSHVAAKEASGQVFAWKHLAREFVEAQRRYINKSRSQSLNQLDDRIRDGRFALAQTTCRRDGVKTSELIRLLKRRDADEREISLRIPSDRLASMVQPVTLEEVLKAMPDASALIEVICSEVADATQPHYLALVMRSSAEKIVVVDIGNCADVDRAIELWRRKLSRCGLFPETQDPAVSATASPTLDQLLSPVLDAVKGARRLMIAPDGNLALIPFEVVRVAADRYLMEDCIVSYLRCARDLVSRPETSERRSQPSVVIADPLFDLSASTLPSEREGHTPAVQLRSGEFGFYPLPGTRAEGAAVAALLGVLPVVGDAVVEKWFKRLRSPQILHVATHGFFLKSEYSPIVTSSYQTGQLNQDTSLLMARSGLALAGAEAWRIGHRPPKEAEDGLLTAEDVLSMNLDGTELVVLSACETGLGTARIGDGVLGLRRAFLMAGSRAVVMSLWKVDDQVTYSLMTLFYRGLASGLGPATALHNAKLAVKRKYPDPWYWGSFICEGVSDKPISIEHTTCLEALERRPEPERRRHPSQSEHAIPKEQWAGYLAAVKTLVGCLSNGEVLFERVQRERPDAECLLHGDTGELLRQRRWIRFNEYGVRFGFPPQKVIDELSDISTELEGATAAAVLRSRVLRARAPSNSSRSSKLHKVEAEMRARRTYVDEWLSTLSMVPFAWLAAAVAAFLIISRSTYDQIGMAIVYGLLFAFPFIAVRQSRLMTKLPDYKRPGRVWGIPDISLLWMVAFPASWICALIDDLWAGIGIGSRGPLVQRVIARMACFVVAWLSCQIIGSTIDRRRLRDMWEDFCLVRIAANEPDRAAAVAQDSFARLGAAGIKLATKGIAVGLAMNLLPAIVVVCLTTCALGVALCYGMVQGHRTYWEDRA